MVVHLDCFVYLSDFLGNRCRRLRVDFPAEAGLDLGAWRLVAGGPL